ncbi:class I SAM-dependent methyltransferase [Ghiorsea bivora]|uniref:class I SAM-dependent methyltransferase n=1 Tax=Ghiorsea bivora TaxID=1485545 RepID=UPI000570328A|nr:class I SAM-dependent methyltransferase [Ghiorsea bivora]
MLTYNEAQRFYDSFGKKQSKQFYEESAMNNLIELGKFDEAKNIIEFGCGTGKLASRLLKNILSRKCYYLGVDISQTMVALCQKNIEQYSDRAKCYKNEGKPIINITDQSADRFISTYVLDLLTEEDIIVLLNEAYRILLPGGYLCLASLTHGTSFVSHIVEFIWSSLYKLKPSIVGGCRPIKISEYLQNDKWHILHDSTIVSYGVPSEVVIARRLQH